jgi:hypothetical protein
MKKFVIHAEDRTTDSCCVSHWYVDRVSPLSMSDEYSDSTVFLNKAEALRCLEKVREQMDTDPDKRFEDLEPEVEEYDEEVYGKPDDAHIYKRQREAARKAWKTMKGRR